MSRIACKGGLFLFGHGLTTFEGKHVNQSLLFPMEEVFEGLVACHFRKHQDKFSVETQGPLEPLAHLEGKDKAFQMKPDITLSSSDKRFILDTKWKRINLQTNDVKRGISQADMYQLYSYGKKYDCEKVALIYPSTDNFKFKEHFHHNFDISYACFVFPSTWRNQKKA